MNETRRTMKIRVTIEVEVDRDSYNAEYGTAAPAEEVRQHIKSAARDAVDQSFQFTDAIRVVS